MEKTKSQALTKEDRELIETNMTGAKICMDLYTAASIGRYSATMMEAGEKARKFYTAALKVVENRLGEERANDEKSPIKLV